MVKLDIKDKMDTLNITRYALAKQLNITYNTMTVMYNGDSVSIKLDVLDALCDALSCQPGDILVKRNPQ